MPSALEITYRPAISTDTQRIEELIESAGLPAEHVDEFIGGFVVAEVDGRIQACGGLEIYANTGVLRSFVVEPNLRRSGLGSEIANRQLSAATRAGLEQLYLFTGESWPFWERLGFNRISFSEWPQQTRDSWQYQLVTTHRAAMERIGIRSMWRPISNLVYAPSLKDRASE